MKTILLVLIFCALNLSLLGQVAFTNSSSPGVGNAPSIITAADVNGDGKIDLITANYGNGYGNTLTILTNDGSGGFVLSSSPSVDAGARWVTAADINGDGQMDLICANYGSVGSGSTLSVLTNDGTGSFVLASSPGLTSAPFSVVALDINGDGYIDLITANADNTVEVLTNDGSGGFVPASSSNLSGNPRAIAAFTNVDGKIDVVTANQYNNTLSFMTNNGNGGFGLAALLSGGNQPFEVTVADVNQDGRMDIISANLGNAKLMIWTNNGVGGFALASSPTVGSQPFAVVAADINLDGKVDLISANYGGNSLTVLTNQGNGIFGLAATLPVGNGPEFVTSADVDGDGKMDLISANGGDNTVSILLNTTPLPPPRATGTAILAFGFVVGVNVNYGGYGYTNTPSVRLIGGGGSGAVATAVVSNGVVISITINNPGAGYTNAPLVVIEPPNIFNPILAVAPASLLVFSNLTVGAAYQLQESVLWYWTNQSVSFTATNVIYTITGVSVGGNYRLAANPVPAQAFATPVVINGFVVAATLTSGGSGYVTSPTVNFVGGGGINAAAISKISGGVVTNITIMNPGSGYTNPPAIQIGQPPVVALLPTIMPAIRVDATNLIPYENYQMQLTPNLNAAWNNLNGGLFSPTNVTSSQYILRTNGAGFFRLQYVP